jgi:hypothetical protein
MAFASGKGLFEFVVPMDAQTRLDGREVAPYTEQLEAGPQPTALALSILDVKQPAN